MALIDATEQTLERLRLAQDAGAAVQAAQEIEQLRTSLNTHAQAIQGLANQLKLLREQGVNLPTIPIERAQSSVQENLNYFKKTPEAATLRQGRRWQNMIQQLEAVNTQAQATLKTHWESYFDNNLFNGLPPNQLRSTLANTPLNLQKLDSYKNNYESFQTYRRRPPVDSQGFTTLRNLSNELNAITFQTDVPPEVKEFIDKAGQDAGVDLGLLTQTVVDWLTENNMMEHYVVRRRR